MRDFLLKLAIFHVLFSNLVAGSEQVDVPPPIAPEDYPDPIEMSPDFYLTQSSTSPPVNTTINHVKTTELEMSRLIFSGTDRDLELHNPLREEDMELVAFTRSIQQCTHLCKWSIGTHHYNNHINKYDMISGKCTCYLLNKQQQQFQHPLHDYSWAPKQSQYQYSLHRNNICFSFFDK